MLQPGSLPDPYQLLSDPSACPECQTPVPELYLAAGGTVTCRSCGRSDLHTGIVVMPVADGAPVRISVANPPWRLSAESGDRSVGVVAPSQPIEIPPIRSQKRSTRRGDGKSKLIAALTNHHRYMDGSTLNQEPIGNNELAKAAEVSSSTASAFFNNEFGSHAKYKALCRDQGRLLAALRLLNNEFAPRELSGRRPSKEDNRDDE